MSVSTITYAGSGTLVLEDFEQLRPDLRANLLRALGAGNYRREGESGSRWEWAIILRQTGAVTLLADGVSRLAKTGRRPSRF